MMGHKVVMSQRRVSCHNLGPANNNARIGLFFYMNVNICHFIRGFVPVNRRVNNGMIYIKNTLLCLFIPTFGIFLIRGIKVSVGSQGG